MLIHPLVTEDPSTVHGRSDRSCAAGGSALRLRMDFVNPRLAVLAVAGDIDAAATPRMAELLWPRLKTKVSTLVLDLSEVTFLGVSGLELLSNAHDYASHRGITLVLVHSTSTVDRALLAGGLYDKLPSFSSVREARVTLGGIEDNFSERSLEPVGADRKQAARKLTAGQQTARKQTA